MPHARFTLAMQDGIKTLSIMGIAPQKVVIEIIVYVGESATSGMDPEMVRWTRTSLSASAYRACIASATTEFGDSEWHPAGVAVTRGVQCSRASGFRAG